MRRPSRLARVFGELRHQRPDVPAWLLLRLAAKIVEAHREPEGFEIDETEARLPFFSREVDRAIEDGGWAVLEADRRRGMAFGDESYYDDRAEARLRRLTGKTGWRRFGTD